MMRIAALLLFTISGWRALGVLPFSESIPYAFNVLNQTSDSITLQMKEGFPSAVSDEQTKRLCFTLPHPERISKTFLDGSTLYFIYSNRQVVEIEPLWTNKGDTTTYKLEVYKIQHINNRSPQVPLFDRIMLIKPRHKHHGEEPSLVTEEHFKIRHKQFEQIRNRKYYVLEGENATVCISVKNRNVDSFLRAIAGDEYSNLIAGDTPERKSSK
jgi:hypothetical protein